MQIGEHYRAGLVIARALAASMALGLGACVAGNSGAEFAEKVAVPDQFAASASSSQGDITSRWWEGFDDPRLNVLVERALSGNPSIKSGIARLRQARATARIERADLLPSISGGAGGLESGGGSAVSDFARYDLDVTASWEADLWGRISAQAAAARTDALASEADLQALRQLIAAETARTYFAVVEAQAQIALSQDVLDTYDELIRQLELRLAAEVTPRSTAALARTDSETARAGLEAQREIYARLIRRLEVLLGDYPDGAALMAQSLPEIPARPPFGVPSQLLARRPDLRSARAGILAAGLRVDAAEAALLPSLTLTGATGFAGDGPSDIFSSGFSVWSIAGRLVQPIFQGGRLRAAVEFREGERDDAIAFYVETALQALVEVETALAVEDLLTRQEQAFDRSASAAEEATRISVLRYEAEIESFFNVLESQQRALAARSAAILARRARLDNRIDLHLALGGDVGGPYPNNAGQ